MAGRDDEAAGEGASEAQDSAALREAALECIRGWHELPTGLAVHRSHEPVFRVGYPLAAHAPNASAAALDLWGSLPWVAMANIRIALEHALAAQWVLLTEGGAAQLVKHMEHDYLRRTKEFAGALRKDSELTREIEPDLLDRLDGVAGRQSAPGSERSWSMQAVFNRFDGSNLFYDVYRELSASVHPSFDTITAHLTLRTQGGGRSHPSGSGASAKDEGFSQGVALASLWALDFIERCLDGVPSPGRAAQIADAARLPYDLAASDQTPERQPNY